MIAEFKIHSPYLIIKDRPHLKSNLEIDLGEMTLFYEEDTVKGRFKKAPNKEALVSKCVMSCSELGIKYSEDDFEVALPF